MKTQKASELKTCKEFDALCADLEKFSELTYKQRQLAKHKERVQKSIAYIAPLIEDKMLSELEKLKKVKKLSFFLLQCCTFVNAWYTQAAQAR